MFLQWAVPGALLPLYSVRLKNLGFGEMDVAACCATQAVASVVSSLVAGQAADRWLSAEKVMATCALLAGLDLWLLAGLRQPLAVFAATLFFWMVTGPMLLLGTTIAFAHLREPEKQFGGVRLWGTVGWVAVGWLVSGWLAGPGWAGAVLRVLRPELPRPTMDDTFRLGGLAAFLLAGYTLSLPRTPPQKAGPGRGLLAPWEALKMLRGGPLATYCACVLGACVTFSFTNQSTPLLLEELGLRRHWLMRTLTLAQTTEVAFLAVLPAVLPRLGVRGTMLLGLLAWLGVMCVLAVGKPLGLVVASLGLNGLYVTGFMITGQMYLNSLAGSGLRASMQGLFSFVNGLGLLAGNLLAGWLRRWTHGELPPTFAVGACITVVLLVLFVAGFRHRSDESRACEGQGAA
jgi:predicted MFS family arabinose efflux permease